MQDRSAPDTPAMEVKIWGARGSVPTPDACNMGVGGNTACVEARSRNGTRVILDAGTGIRQLGREIVADRNGPREVHIFLSHFHWDHIQGLPFFQPLYSPAYTVVFHSHLEPRETERVLRSQMAPPYFPVAWDELPAAVQYQQFGHTPDTLGDLLVAPVELRHPGGSWGFVLQCDDARVVYATDYEIGDSNVDERFISAAHRADLLILDAQFTPEEYTSRKGWGHSTWQQAARIAEAAEAERLLLFHHDPGHIDAHLRAIVQQARTEFAATELAHDSAAFTV